MKKSTKRIITIYSLILVATLLGETILANAIASTFTISSGVYPGAPTYTIWVESGTYYAKDNYGNLAYSGTNATTLITAVVNHNYSTVLFEPGIYFINSYGGIQLGDVTNQIHDSSYYGYGAILRNSYTGSQGNLFDVYGENLQFYGLTLDGNRLGLGISLLPTYGTQWTLRVGGVGTRNILLQDVQLINCLGCGFISGNGRDITFRNCLIDGADEHPIYTDTGNDHVVFDTCIIRNWAQRHRGWVKVAFSTNVQFLNCVFDVTEDGHTPSAVGGGSYELDTAGSNSTLFQNCLFINPLGSLLELGGAGQPTFSTRFLNCNFTKTYRDDSAMEVIYDQGNFTVIEGCRFYNWTYRIIMCYDSSDAQIRNNYFSGGVSSSGITFGFRTMITGNYWYPDITNGVYGIDDATGTGKFILNDVCNSTLTFNLPAGVEAAHNLYH